MWAAFNRCGGGELQCARSGSETGKANRFCLGTSSEDFSAPVGERPFLDILPVGLHRVSHG